MVKPVKRPPGKERVCGLMSRLHCGFCFSSRSSAPSVDAVLQGLLWWRRYFWQNTLQTNSGRILRQILNHSANEPVAPRSWPRGPSFGAITVGSFRLSSHSLSVAALPSQLIHLYFFYTFAQSRRSPHPVTFRRGAATWTSAPLRDRKTRGAGPSSLVARDERPIPRLAEILRHSFPAPRPKLLSENAFRVQMPVTP
jgi:hypothetical protein